MLCNKSNRFIYRSSCQTVKKISPVLDWPSTLRNWRFCQVTWHRN